MDQEAVDDSEGHLLLVDLDPEKIMMQAETEMREEKDLDSAMRFFPEHIRKLARLYSNGYKQLEAATEMGVTVRTLHAWEKRYPFLVRVRKPTS